MKIEMRRISLFIADDINSIDAGLNYAHQIKRHRGESLTNLTA